MKFIIRNFHLRYVDTFLAPEIQPLDSAKSRRVFDRREPPLQGTLNLKFTMVSIPNFAMIMLVK